MSFLANLKLPQKFPLAEKSLDIILVKPAPALHFTVWDGVRYNNNGFS